MTKIQYRLASGKTVEVEVTEEQAEVIIKTKRKFENNETKFKLRKLRETSLEQIRDDYDWEQADDTIDVQGEFERTETAEEVRQAVETLNAKQRELVRLYFYEEKTQVEIAAIFGVDQSCIAKQIKTVCGKLKKLLAKSF